MEEEIKDLEELDLLQEPTEEPTEIALAPLTHDGNEAISGTLEEDKDVIFDEISE